MSRFLTFLTVSAAVVLGACSDTQPPTSSTEPQAELGTQQSAQLGQIDVGLNAQTPLGTKGVGTASVASGCNSGGSECMTVYHLHNPNTAYVSRVGSTATSYYFGCSRAHFYTNGYLRYRSAEVCHGAGNRLFANWYPGNPHFYYGTNFCVDWKGSYGSPRGSVCRRLTR